MAIPLARVTRLTATRALARPKLRERYWAASFGDIGRAIQELLRNPDSGRKFADSAGQTAETSTGAAFGFIT
jgi:hypothetical protein